MIPINDESFRYGMSYQRVRQLMENTQTVKTETIEIVSASSGYLGDWYPDQCRNNNYCGFCKVGGEGLTGAVTDGSQNFHSDTMYVRIQAITHRCLFFTMLFHKRRYGGCFRAVLPIKADDANLFLQMNPTIRDALQSSLHNPLISIILEYSSPYVELCQSLIDSKVIPSMYCIKDGYQAVQSRISFVPLERLDNDKKGPYQHFKVHYMNMIENFQHFLIGRSCYGNFFNGEFVDFYPTEDHPLDYVFEDGNVEELARSLRGRDRDILYRIV